MSLWIDELSQSAPSMFSFLHAQAITIKKTPHSQSTPIIIQPRIEASPVMMNMNEQMMSKMPRPIVVFKNIKFVFSHLKSQKLIVIRSPKNLFLYNDTNLHLIEEKSQSEYDLRFSAQKAEYVENAKDNHRNSNSKIQKLNEGCILASACFTCTFRHFYLIIITLNQLNKSNPILQF